MAESESSGSGGSTPPEQPELCGGTTGAAMMGVMFITIFIMFNPDLRISIAEALDGVMSPIFAFDDKYPIVTLLFTALILITLTTIIRHFMTDWIGIARAQKITTAFNKERTDAMMSGNTVKLKKIEEMAPEMQKYQMTLMTSNLRPMIFTMLIFIVLFPWVWMVYMERLNFTYISLPGIQKWDFNVQSPICFNYFKNWIIVYMLLSFPIGFLLQNGLKYFTFKYKIKQTEVVQDKIIREDISELEERINEIQNDGIQVNKSKELILKARDKLEEKEYTSAAKILAEANDHIDNKTQTHTRIIGLIAEAEKMVKNAKKRGINVNTSEKSLVNSKKALKRNDDTSAIYYAKQSQRNVKESRLKHKNAEETLSSIKAKMYDLRDLNTEEADEVFKLAEEAMENKDYALVLKHSKSTKMKAEEINNIFKKAASTVQKAKNAMDNIHHLELDIPDAEGLYNKANNALKDHNYSSAIEFGNQCIDIVTGEREKFQEAQESVSFAKLIVANAISFGANVQNAESITADAELALTHKNYERAIELANEAKNIAESAKRQQQRQDKRK